MLSLNKLRNIESAPVVIHDPVVPVIIHDEIHFEISDEDGYAAEYVTIGERNEAGLQMMVRMLKQKLNRIKPALKEIYIDLWCIDQESLINYHGLTKDEIITCANQ